MKIMYTLPKAIFFTFILLASSQTMVMAQSPESSDEELVYQAVQDYLLGLYMAEPERIARSVDTTLRKIGYYTYNGENYDHVPMTFDQLHELAGKWNANGDQVTEETPQVIEIYEVHDRTASAKLTAKWGIDFMHLSKVDGRWKIMNIIWQSQPK